MGVFLIILTSVERNIHRALRARAQGANPTHPATACISYKELGLMIDPEGKSWAVSRAPFRRMFPALGHVSAYETEHGRPMLSALVVREDSRKPGSGYIQLARDCGIATENEGEEFWKQQLTEVVRFWATGDPVLLLDAAVDKLMSEFATLKSLVRKSMTVQ
jgi:hypothetical protein